jgi:hypothetical protein
MSRMRESEGTHCTRDYERPPLQPANTSTPSSFTRGRFSHTISVRSGPIGVGRVRRPRLPPPPSPPLPNLLVPSCSNRHRRACCCFHLSISYTLEAQIDTMLV